jgi:RHS repeat-associated protein
MFYAYDADGNLIAEQAGSPPVTGVDGSDRVIRYHEGVFSVDYGFALTNRPPIDTGGNNVFRRDFMWNDRGLLRRSIDRQFDVQYRYGHDGQRALKYSLSGSQHRETLYFNRMFTITQMATRDIESKHIFVGNTRIVTKRRQAEHDNIGHEIRMQYFYHGDHLGSVQLVTDWEGNIYEHLEYTPYGELWVDHSVSGVGAYPTVFRFTAHERDPETGFTYAGARYLDPRTSRWISADPAMWEGDYFPRPGQGARDLPGMGGIFNIVNMHVFHYAGNNPIKYVDPDGRFKFLAIPLAVNYAPAIVAACVAAATTIAALPLFSRIGDAISWAVEAGRGRSGAETTTPKSGQTPQTEKEHTPDQATAVKLANEAKRAGGVNQADAETLVEWGNEVNLRPPSRGPESHPNRRQPSSQNPHIHVGPVDHIPVVP